MALLQITSASSWFGSIKTVRDPELQIQLPVGKVRGRRGYYRALQREAAAFYVRQPGPFDYMHWHVDWQGLGNLRWKERREHLRALFKTFECLEVETAEWSTPFQIWLQIDARDSSQDAVYLHSPNSHTEFPNRFENVSWDVPVPERLQEFMSKAGWQFGRYDELWTHFLVRQRPAV